MRSSRAALVVAVIVGIAAPAAAQQAQAGGAVNSFYGSFGTEVPIAMPDFHGVVPKLKLVYNSGAPNGWIGPGWAIAGPSVIERASAERGLPRWDGTDTFILDGQELVPCTTLGGTHCTKIQGYQRITQSGSTWYVWSKDGTRATYTPLLQTTAGTLRWAMTSLQHPRGHTVSFNYWCDAGYDCYLDTVAYNGTTIKFYSEPRTDSIVYNVGAPLTGTGGPATTRYRLKTIDISTGTAGTCYDSCTCYDGCGVPYACQCNPHPCAARARAYALTYGYNNSTARSVLASIRQYGGDAVLDASGSITGGTALPAMTYTYEARRDTWAGGSYSGGWSGQTDRWGGHGVGTDGATYADIDGDGKMEYITRSGGTHYITRYTPQGVVNQVFTGCHGLGSDGWTYADIDGDGKAEYVTRSGSDHYVSHYTATGCVNETWIGAGHGTGTDGWTYADIDGDGKAEYITRTGGTHFITRYTPTGLVNSTFGGCHGVGSDGWTYADIDGDGKAEYVTRTGGTHYVTRYTHVGLINQTFTGCAGNGGQGWSYADVDGDGRADYVTLGTGADTRMTVSRYNGTSCTTEAWIVPYPGAAGTTWVDVYGSGRSVLVSRGTDYVHVVTDALQVADKLTLMQNGLGAYTRITYAPSSGWANTFLPQGMILQAVTALSTSSGRDGASTANYRYEGGLWSSAERRFLGFRKATAVLDARGNYTEIYYHQHVGCVSKPETSYYRDAAGNLYSYASFTYEENAAAPYTSRLKQRWDYECNQTASCRRVVSQLDYDGYGNVVATYEWGDLDVGGDERTAYRGYYPNWGAYIVGLPAYENLYAGIGTGGPLAKQTLWEYDGAGTYAAAPTLGSISRKQLWDSSTGGYAISSYAYDAWGNVTRQTDAMGGVTTTTYDPLAHLYPTSTCDALGFCTTQTWDNALGAITAKTDPNGMTTSYTYDALGRPARKTLADGSWTQHEYLSWGDVWNQRSRETTADGSNAPPYRETFFDGLGRNYRTVRSGQAGGTCYDLCPSTCTDGCGYFYPCNVQCNPHPCYGVGTYQKDRIYSDASSRVWKESSWFTAGEAASWVVYAYDGAGRVQTVTNADGSVSQRSYGNGYAATYDELGAERVEWHDAYGRKIQIRERNGGSYAATTYRYDVLGNVVQSVDAAGSVSTFTWDSLSRKRSACDPDTGCHTYTPDALGRVLAQTDAKGQTVSATYDALGRVRTRGGATFVYDEAGHGASKGQLTTMIDGTGSESLSYDFRGQPTAQTKCVANICYTMQFGHDWLGRLATVTYPDGEVVTNRYDQAARVAGVSGYVSSLIYGANDQLLSAAFANGTTESFTYDPVRRWMTSAAVTGPSGATLYQASYAYEANGRVRQVTSTTNPLLNLTFGYDDLNRLLSVSGGQRQSFAYDAVGNMTYNSAIGGYTYGDAAHEHAVTAAGATGYSYDANGNMTAGAGRSLTWNADNQPLTVTKNGATTTYGYDGKGRRVSKVAPGSTSLYYGKFLELTNGSLVKYYYAGPVLVAKRDATGPSWYHQDHLGSVRALTNGAGLVINRYDYGAFGATVGASEGVANRFTFGGHRKDTENGLVFMNARYYDPDLGRFISADPIVPDPSNPQTLNRYSYANNNPISNVDPTGHGAVATIIVTVVVCVAAAWTGQWWVFALALVGGGCSVAGYYTNNPWLMSIGQVLLGAATGGWVGAVVAAMTSPVSPLDPKIKQAIGWAYMTYGLVNAAYEGYQQAESINGEPEAFADVEAGADEMTGPDGGSNAYEPGAGSAGSGDAASIVTQDAQKASMSTREWSIFDTRSASGAGDWSRPYDPSINYFGPEGTANLLWGHVPEWLNRLSYIHDAVLGADGFMVSNYVQAFVLDAMVGARGATGAAFTIARPPSEVFTIFSDLHVQ